MKDSFFFVILVTVLSCSSVPKKDINYRDEMRSFVAEISTYTKSQKNDFVIIPQNGHELLLNEEGNPHKAYLKAIDGVGQENLNFGYTGDNESTPLESKKYMRQFLEIGSENGKQVLITDYTWEPEKKRTSVRTNNLYGYITFTAPERDLNVIPESPIALLKATESDRDISNLSEAKNFLYFLNFENFETKQELLSSIADTEYDVIIMDAFFHGKILNRIDLNSIRWKKNGGKRLLISYMSIGEAEDYRFYWNSDWDNVTPEWLGDENPNWKGNYKVQFWQNDWKEIIYGDSDSYAQQILDAGFDGLYLDIIDAFWYFENKKLLNQ